MLILLRNANHKTTRSVLDLRKLHLFSLIHCPYLSFPLRPITEPPLPLKHVLPLPLLHCNCRSQPTQALPRPQVSRMASARHLGEEVRVRALERISGVRREIEERVAPTLLGIKTSLVEEYGHRLITCDLHPNRVPTRQLWVFCT
ncbi:hypothetical protein VNO80_15346 [Phaseolus coccineus]|uniref:Uncharacterized protein n=1 Tax=Phaseolus coccineus TaxID=3886 RepID=A0AAN9MK47_PHACN